MNVLVVDDDELTRTLLVGALNGLGHRAREASDGDEAWDMIVADPPEVVLSDWAMPRLDGLELCARVRATDSESYVYFVLMTAHDDRERALLAMESGVDDYLSKPLDVGELAGRLTIAERTVRLQRQLLNQRTELARSLSEQRAVVEQAPFGILRLDSSGQGVMANARFTQLTGLDTDRAAGDGWRDAFGSDAATIDEAASSAAHRAPDPREVRLRRPDGSSGWARVRVARVDHGEAGTFGYLVTVVDVTAEVEATAHARRLTTVLDTSTDLVAITDGAGTIVYANPALCELGVSGPPEASGLDELLRMFDPADHERLLVELPGALMRAGRWQGELTVLAPGRPAMVGSMVSMALVDDDGNLAGASTVLRDITHLKEVELRLAHAAAHDPLTDLPNRTLLVDRMTQALARRQRHGTVVALLFCDLDGFKAVNDAFGHGVGDDLLAEVAERLRDCVRQADTAARLSGDEFVVLYEHPPVEDPGAEHADSEGVAAAPEAAITDIDVVAQRVLNRLSEPYDLLAGGPAVTVSIGLAVATDADTPDSLLSRADTAMYVAKRSGKHRIVDAETWR